MISEWFYSVLWLCILFSTCICFLIKGFNRFSLFVFLLVCFSVSFSTLLYFFSLLNLKFRSQRYKLKTSCILMCVFFASLITWSSHFASLAVKVKLCLLYLLQRIWKRCCFIRLLFNVRKFAELVYRKIMTVENVYGRDEDLRNKNMWCYH